MCPYMVYKLPEGDFDSVATRFSLPVRALAYSPSGTNLAASGDDEGIKLISAAESKVFRTFRAAPYTRSLAYDPESEFLGSVSAEGTLQIWDMANGKITYAQKKVDVTSARRNGIAWHPDGGSLLAVPGLENDVSLFERLSWNVALTLKGPHSAAVNLVSFSPNGLYLVSAGTDQLLVLWDVGLRKALCQRSTPSTVTAVSWHPQDNSLACMSEEGSVAVWDGIVPEGHPGPHISPDSLLAQGVTSPQEGGGERGGSVDPTREGDEGMGSFIDHDMEGDMGGDAFDPGSVVKKRKGLGSRALYASAGARPQPPIQPGATLTGDSSDRRFLAYNALGCIISKEGEEYNTIEVALHDTRAHRRRMPNLNDLFRFSIASLGDRGVMYASRSSKDAPSTVMYRPFDSWAANSDWQVSLPTGDEALAVTAGQSFSAVATSQHMLRVFSPAGLQTFVMTLQGMPVALASQGHLLAAVWHAASPSATDDQCLQYAVFDVSQQQQVHHGPLPLTPGTTLSWLGFSEESLLASYDSEGVLRLRSREYGGCWVPAFVSSQQRKNSEVYWPVSLTLTQLTCIVCTATQPIPQVSPRPVLTNVALQVPVLAADASSAQLEADLLKGNLQLTHTRLQLADLVEAGEGSTEEAEQAVSVCEVALDRALLKLFNAAVRGSRLQQALEAACQLSQVRSLEGAIKLANHNRQTALAERITMFLETRLELEAAEEADQEMSPEAVLIEDATTAEDMPSSSSPRTKPSASPAPEGGAVKANPSITRKPLLSTGNLVSQLKDAASKPSGKRKAQPQSGNPFARSKVSKS
ncbi:hypothetical protein ABBQ38_013311 [Trebouxia sp. C0009 RCD-2024]